MDSAIIAEAGLKWPLFVIVSDLHRQRRPRTIKTSIFELQAYRYILVQALWHVGLLFDWEQGIWEMGKIEISLINTFR